MACATGFCQVAQGSLAASAGTAADVCRAWLADTKCIGLADMLNYSEREDRLALRWTASVKANARKLGFTLVKDVLIGVPTGCR